MIRGTWRKSGDEEHVRMALGDPDCFVHRGSIKRDTVTWSKAYSTLKVINIF